jgi:hypothetical protein
MKRLALAALLVLSCSRGPQLPVDTLLWRVGEWREAAGIRKAPAAFISFRRTTQFIQHLTYVIEQPDTTIYFAANSQHVVVIGKWKKEGRETVVTPEIIWRTTPATGRDPLCEGTMRFTVSGESNTVTGPDGQYSPITRLVAPDFENYINDAAKKGFVCHPPEPR